MAADLHAPGRSFKCVQALPRARWSQECIDRQTFLRFLAKEAYKHGCDLSFPCNGREEEIFGIKDIAAQCANSYDRRLSPRITWPPICRPYAASSAQQCMICVALCHLLAACLLQCLSRHLHDHTYLQSARRHVTCMTALVL